MTAPKAGRTLPAAPPRPAPAVAAQQAALIARAKARAVPVVSRVQARIPLGAVLADCAWPDLYALIVVLAEAVDPARLRGVVEATDTDPVTEYRAARQQHQRQRGRAA